MVDKIKEVWLGPGKKDGQIREFKPENDGLHIDMKKGGNFEWWYFDARLDNGYMAVGFFRAKHERTGKTGVEITIYKPTGEKIQRIFDYEHSDLIASTKDANVKIGNNYINVDYTNEELPTFEIFLKEEDIGIHLHYKPKVRGWMPGEGYTEFGNMGEFGWAIAIPRADVEGTLTVNNQEITVKGIGYHDHNWLTFNLVRVVEYWYWGRVYSKNFTIIYAYIKCNKKMDNYPINILMVAKGEKIILSTGEFELIDKDFQFNEKAGNKYPKSLIFKLSDKRIITLDVQEIVDADNLLFELNPILRILAKYLLRIKPGYFRLKSKFSIDFADGDIVYKEEGDTLHEMVIVK
ncbi:MAG: lipocalin-like domain-containing protein [Candidatus Hermodarchaeota archaeon]